MILENYTDNRGESRPGISFSETDLARLRHLEGEAKVGFLAELGTALGNDVYDGTALGHDVPEGTTFYGGADEIVIAMTDDRQVTKVALSSADRRMLTESALGEFHALEASEMVSSGGEVA